MPSSPRKVPVVSVYFCTALKCCFGEKTGVLGFSSFLSEPWNGLICHGDLWFVHYLWESAVCFVITLWVIRMRCLVQVSIVPVDCLQKLPSMISYFLKKPALVFFKAGVEGLEAVCCHLPSITADRPPSSKQPLVCCSPQVSCCHS